MTLQRITTLFLTASILTFAALVLPGETHAATTASMSPVTGTFNSDFTLSVVINTGGDTINGADATVTYSGAATFVSGTTGTLGCTPTINASGGSISIICLIPPGDDFSGTGTLARLTFRPSSTGTFTARPTYLDVGSSVGTLTGGSYVITSSGSTGTLTTLPNTGIVDEHPEVIAAFFLFFLAGVIAFMNVDSQLKTNIEKKMTRFEKKILELID